MPSHLPAGPSIGRRRLVRTAAWTVPTVTAVLAIPEYAAASGGPAVSATNPRIVHDAGTSTYHVAFDSVTFSNPPPLIYTFTVQTLWQDAGGGGHTVTFLSGGGPGYSNPAPGTASTSFAFGVAGTTGGAFDAAFDVPNPQPSGPNATIMILNVYAVGATDYMSPPQTVQYNQPLMLPS